MKENQEVFATLNEEQSPTDHNAVYGELERSIRTALQTYSNVHRGSGHYSRITTEVYEKARQIVLDYLGLDQTNYVLIFGSPLSSEKLSGKLKPGSFQSISSADLGLPLGVTALAVRKKVLAGMTPVFAGGGNARLVSKDWVVWARPPAKFEAGTPAIINVITFAKALQLSRKYGLKTFAGKKKSSKSRELLFGDQEGLSGEALLEKLQETMTGKETEVALAGGKRHFVNLDNAASTPAFGPARDVFIRSLSLDEKSRIAMIAASKEICHSFLEAPADEYELIYTANTTEAINLAAGSFARKSAYNTDTVVLGSVMEHSSNDLAWREKYSITQLRLDADKNGFFDLDQLEDLLIDYNKLHKYGNKKIRMVAITGCSNVMGSYNDLKAISRIVHHYGALLLVDAAQMLAHRKIRMKSLDIDFLACSAHKAYAPFGTAVLLTKKGLLNFNTMELQSIRQSGEENAAGIAAFGKSLELLQRIGMDVIREKEQALTAKLLIGMSKIGKVRMQGVIDPQSEQFRDKGGVIVFDLKGTLPGKLAAELASRGAIGVRSGCHCAHIMIKHLAGVGPGLERFQKLIVQLFPKLELPGFVRVSLGIENTTEDIDHFLAVLKDIAAKSDEAVPKNQRKRIMDEFVENKVNKVFKDGPKAYSS